MNIQFNKLFFLFFVLFLFILSSCRGYKNLVYLEDVQKMDPAILEQTIGVNEPKIMPNDVLSITVSSEVKGAAADFNLPILASGSQDNIQTHVGTSSSAGTLQNYLVDNEGIINFPILGRIVLKGKTISEAQNDIENMIYPHYISSKPIVNVRQLNFTVSVLGEVNKPGIYKTDNGQMTILDALAAAGDMTIYGVRKNVLLVRTDSDGELSFHRINLQDKDIVLAKNLFYLQQNDKLYVQVNRAKGNGSGFGTTETISISALSAIISIIAIATR